MLIKIYFLYNNWSNLNNCYYKTKEKVIFIVMGLLLTNFKYLKQFSFGISIFRYFKNILCQ
jgi:hypothetical protein